MTSPQGALPLEANPEPIAWSGKLSELLAVLTAELQGAEDNTWAFRQLRHGAMVAVKLTDERRRILRIARESRPASHHGWELWARELETFKRHLGIEHWYPVPDEAAKGVAVRFQELYPGECRPGYATCTSEGCGKEIPYDRVWGSRQRCENCARLAGEAESREILARRAAE